MKWRPLPGLTMASSRKPMVAMGIVKPGTFPALFSWKAAIYGRAKFSLMKIDATHNPNTSKAPTAAATELNNLLEIISGTSSVIESIWEGCAGSQKYFEMLRASVDRAAKVTAQLVEHAGGTEENALLHPDLVDFAPAKNARPPAP